MTRATAGFQARKAPVACMLVAAMLLGTTAPAGATEQCLTKQHVNMIVNVRVALSQKTNIMDSCITPTQQACIRDCCSKDLVPGFKCNMVVYQLNKPLGSDNCYLFHCEREENCPLLAMDGVNSYYIFKGVDQYNPSNMTTMSPIATTSSAPPFVRAVDARGVLKTSLAAAVVVGLVFLTLAVALLGRKALESFNRRHYTRLELNDLQYDV
ncbi:hypothetical protein AGOR_G00248330 [Albula goreensis]|uniref:MANSC domain-containing protein n=1 Tax=Albula goreensis TaxID=1534307 RepID=A0A8T3CB68_9TELE|nr:hypothetical protein AGOR_G00248330 [Albula goreensis]